MRNEKLILAGSETQGTGIFSVRSPFDGATVAHVAQAGPDHLLQAINQAANAKQVLADMPPHQRASILDRTASFLAAAKEEFAKLIVEEAGKPLTLARLEVDRCVETLTECARQARSWHGKLLELGTFPSGEGRWGLVKRVPLGVVVAITPFNFPLNLVAHKLGPAVAAGCPIILKPASQTPSPALRLGQTLLQAGLPPQSLSVVPCSGSHALPLVEAPEVRLVTFTGSATVGWELKRRAWDKRVTLELGGNAAVLVEPDAGDFAQVAQRIASGAFAYAGQSCISVQRILVARACYSSFRDALVAACERFPTGDPNESSTLCGPMISKGDADRIENWVGTATQAGARLITSWRREGNLVWPQLLEDVPHNHPLWSEEAFAPVAVLQPYETFQEALALVNASRFGLQCGIFTQDVGKLLKAWAALEVGAVIAGDIPSWRTDPMPYGGVKQSGFGREGPAWAMEEMTELRLLVLREN
ncbi:MAG: aldehyde dehydrogenase family protein [Thermoanaerobaculaceae bacterium]